MSDAKRPSSEKLPRVKDSDHKRAIALHYKQADELPKVVASGVDELAEKIIELAELHNIPIHKDGALAELLGKVGQGTVISKESYRLVAEVISFLYHMNEEWRTKHSELDTLLAPTLNVSAAKIPLE